jgi:hypothetical protein
MRFPTLGSAMLSPPPVLTLPLDEEIETRPRSDTTVAAVRLVDDGLTVEEQKRLRRTKSQAIDKTELRKRIGSSKKLKDRRLVALLLVLLFSLLTRVLAAMD